MLFLTAGSDPSDGFSVETTKQWDMPSRHISPQSFDDILSDLGDDPAIPDPHGIRRSPTPKDTAYPAPNQTKNGAFSTTHFQVKHGNLLLCLCAIGVAITLIITIFLTLESFKADSRLALEGAQSQLTELKKELAQYRNDVENSQDDLYEAMEELEVSIHSKIISSPQTKSLSAPKVDPHESELRRWRYLGMTQVGGAQQAFFVSRKARFTLQLNNPVLGDWRLSEIQKDRATLTNPKGKSLTLKALKIE